DLTGLLRPRGRTSAATGRGTGPGQQQAGSNSGGAAPEARCCHNCGIGACTPAGRPGSPARGTRAGHATEHISSFARGGRPFAQRTDSSGGAAGSQAAIGRRRADGGSSADGLVAAPRSASELCSNEGRAGGGGGRRGRFSTQGLSCRGGRRQSNKLRGGQSTRSAPTHLYFRGADRRQYAAI